MITDWWDKPVSVMIGGKTTYTVERMDKAAELILGDWPVNEGPAYVNAKEAILKALEDPTSQSARQSARVAFRAAAEEAGILIER